MADIAMCLNEECKHKKLCYRHEATPTPRRQSYMSFTPRKNYRGEKFQCSGFMAISK